MIGRAEVDKLLKLRAAGPSLLSLYGHDQRIAAEFLREPPDGRTVSGLNACLAAAGQWKGATRALPPGHADLPADPRQAGQPVLIPGSVGTSSSVLAGVAGGGAFASACHGAGRLMSRHQAALSITGPELPRLERQGIAVRGASARGLAEETPQAYKDITQVVEAAEGARPCRKVARLVPLGVIKG